MNNLGRTIYKLQIPAVIVLPIWIGIGRLLFGAGGWLMLITLFLLTPVLFIWLLVLAIATLARHDVRDNKALPLRDAKIFAVVYGAMVLFGFFLVDVGDTEDSVGSAFSMLLGHHLVGLSVVLAVMTGFVSFVALLIASMLTIRSLTQSRRKPTPPDPKAR